MNIIINQCYDILIKINFIEFYCTRKLIVNLILSQKLCPLAKKKKKRNEIPNDKPYFYLFFFDFR